MKLLVSTALFSAIAGLSGSEAAATAVHNITTPARALASGSHVRLCGVDIPGGDVSSAKTSSAKTCEKACGPFSINMAFTWTDYEGGTCWCKKFYSTASGYDPQSGDKLWTTDAKPKTRTVSVVPANGMIGVRVHEYADMDMSGNDLTNQPASYEACTGLCYRNSNCFALTWTNYQGGTCWLKTGGSDLAYSQGAKSSIFARESEDECVFSS